MSNSKQSLIRTPSSTSSSIPQSNPSTRSASTFSRRSTSQRGDKSDLESISSAHTTTSSSSTLNTNKLSQSSSKITIISGTETTRSQALHADSVSKSAHHSLYNRSRSYKSGGDSSFASSKQIAQKSHAFKESFATEYNIPIEESGAIYKLDAKSTHTNQSTKTLPHSKSITTRSYPAKSNGNTVSGIPKQTVLFIEEVSVGFVDSVDAFREFTFVQKVLASGVDVIVDDLRICDQKYMKRHTNWRRNRKSFPLNTDDLAMDVVMMPGEIRFYERTVLLPSDEFGYNEMVDWLSEEFAVEELEVVLNELNQEKVGFEEESQGNSEENEIVLKAIDERIEAVEKAIDAIEKFEEEVMKSNAPSAEAHYHRMLYLSRVNKNFDKAESNSDDDVDENGAEEEEEEEEEEMDEEELEVMNVTKKSQKSPIFASFIANEKDIEIDESYSSGNGLKSSKSFSKFITKHTQKSKLRQERIDSGAAIFLNLGARGLVNSNPGARGLVNSKSNLSNETLPTNPLGESRVLVREKPAVDTESSTFYFGDPSQLKGGQLDTVSYEMMRKPDEEEKNASEKVSKFSILKSKKTGENELQKQVSFADDNFILRDAIARLPVSESDDDDDDDDESTQNDAIIHESVSATFHINR